MKRFVKKMLCLCLTMLSLVLPVYAYQTEVYEDVEIAQPKFTYINVFQNTLDISSSGKASVTVYLNASNVDEARVVAYLQQYKDGSWSTIKSWSESKFDTSCGLGKTYFVVSGYSYRLKSYGYLYKDGAFVESTSYIGSNVYY